MNQRQFSLLWMVILGFAICWPSHSHAQTHPILIPQIGHSGTIVNAEINQENQWLATFGTDDDVLIWDLNAMKVFRRFTGHQSLLLKGGDLTFFKDGNQPMLASFSREQYGVAIWNILQNQNTAFWKIPNQIHPDRVTSIIYQNRDHLLICGTAMLAIMDPQNGSIVLTWKVPKSLMDGDYPKKNWGPAQGELIIKNRIHPLGHSGLVAIRTNQTISIMDVASNKIRHSFELDSTMLSLAWRQDDEQLAILFQGGIKMVNLRDNQMFQHPFDTRNSAFGAPMRFAQNGSKLFVKKSKNQSTIINFQTGEVLDIPIGNSSDVFLNEEDHNLIAIKDSKPLQYILLNNELIGEFVPQTFRFISDRLTVCDNDNYLIYTARESSLAHDSVHLYAMNRSTLSSKRLHTNSFSHRYKMISGASQAGRMAAITDANVLLVLDVHTGESVFSETEQKVLESYKCISLNITPDGRFVLLAFQLKSSSDATIYFSKIDLQSDRSLSDQLLSRSIIAQSGTLQEMTQVGNHVILRFPFELRMMTWDQPSAAEVLRSIGKDEFSYVQCSAISDHEIAIYTREHQLIVLNIDTRMVAKRFQLDYSDYLSGIHRFDSNHVLLTPSHDMGGIALLVNIHSGTTQKVTTGHAQDILSATSTSHFIITSSSGAGIRFLSKTDQNNRASLFTLPDGQSLLTSNTEYYSGSARAIRYMNYTYLERSYDPTLFDLESNRHDILLSEIGQNAETSINWYTNLYEKRKANTPVIRKPSNLNSSDLRLEIINNIPILQSEQAIPIPFRVRTGNAPSKSLHVLVNDIPLNGSKGFPLSIPSQSTLDTSLIIDISKGENRLEYYLTDSGNRESARYYQKVVYRPAVPVKPKMYLISLGVTHYRDSAYNLTYAVKDGDDLTSAFQSLYKEQFEVRVLKLQDSLVNRQSLDRIRLFLQSAQPDDYVYMYFSGHGLLDSSYRLFLATHDMDFNHPEVSGILAQELEWVLSACKSRQKILFLDACHSGLVDRDLMGNEMDAKPIDQSVNTKGGRSTSNASASQKLVFNQMRAIYADLSESTGVNVFAAAGGLEFALESQDWKNGAFTHCLLKLLNDGCAQADGNNDYAVDVRELFGSLSNEVMELTHGRQQPVSRNEIRTPFNMLDCSDVFDFFDE
ncbi:MAG: caspase family protein [Flavobacteriales bacterium]|nr:caspase family protein [Flavobacteriales bacterium]